MDISAMRPSRQGDPDEVSYHTPLTLPNAFGTPVCSTLYRSLPFAFRQRPALARNNPRLTRRTAWTACWPMVLDQEGCTWRCTSLRSRSPGCPPTLPCTGAMGWRVCWPCKSPTSTSTRQCD